jgi:hypothetical protein
MATPLRCSSKKHAEVINDHTIEVKCSSRFCGAGRGVVILHRFDLTTGKSTTRIYRDPIKKKESSR